MNGEKLQDRVIRSITDDGAFRVIVAMTTNTVRGAIAAQKAEGTTAARFGELLTGSVLIREAMSPDLRVQGILKIPSSGSLVADAHPDGMTRGLVGFSGKASIVSGQSALLEMMRTLPNGSLHRGIVEVSFDAAEGGISAALMEYMQQSEQIVSMIAVSTVTQGDQVIAAGGYMVELLPEIERGPLMIMTQRLEDFPPINEIMSNETTSAATLTAELLYGMKHTLLAESPVFYGCNCSELRVLSSLVTLPREDIESLFAEKKALEIECDYCRKQYAIAPQQLQSFLTTT